MLQQNWLGKARWMISFSDPTNPAKGASGPVNTWSLLPSRTWQYLKRCPAGCAEARCVPTVRDWPLVPTVHHSGLFAPSLAIAALVAFNLNFFYYSSTTHTSAETPHSLSASFRTQYPAEPALMAVSKPTKRSLDQAVLLIDTSQWPFRKAAQPRANKQTEKEGAWIVGCVDVDSIDARRPPKVPDSLQFVSQNL